MKAASRPICPRAFEVEAFRDGRLGGAELARFRAHLDKCSVCSAEGEAFEALGAALRAPVSSDMVDELRVRRERVRLLAAFDASLVPSPEPRKRWRLPSLVFVVVASLALAMLWRAQRRPEPTISSREGVKVQADPRAKWSRDRQAELETITLESGTLSVHVDHRATRPQRLLVALPDGELEDIGTTFSVSAEAGRTTHVNVTDGTVALRLRGAPPLMLFAGDSWTPPVPPPPMLTSAVPAPPPPQVPPLPPSARRERSATPATSTSAPPTPDASPQDASLLFRAAVAALNAGRSSEAASSFAAFLARFPRDSRAEDAAYLRVLAFQRSGNEAATRQAAHEYLARYPQGFRHAEVDVLTR